MNIFVLDRNPIKAVQMMCDAHVVKMIVESCQLLSTNDRLHCRFADSSGLYKSTHVSHPCRIYLASEYNRAWLICHLSALLVEYTHRFGKVHKSAELYHRYYYSEVFKPEIQDIFVRASSWSKFILPKCMPDEFKDGDDSIDSVVLSYRKYYRHKQRTMKRFRYTNRDIPNWLKGSNYEQSL